MLISSALCRAQEAHHHKRAAESDLANVKAVATQAAAAWAIEAISAERRERRLAQPQPRPIVSHPEDADLDETPDAETANH